MKIMWKSLVQGHMDYASQLYQPLQSGDLASKSIYQENPTSEGIGKD